ncbi:MAG: Rpn family recombination-promoting nuclease/putative transposase [Leptolyngbyaceae cyanobacterium MO_188.B28]|nr:Rpn family recombination-promoting nuclease/putative transposase [Leptolyngbyaceae cyanobacterium MO_188.B28]
MVFINPKTDFAFKKIFGSPQSKDILINFLNAILYQEQNIIQDLEILDPYQAPRIRGIKDSFLDVKAVITGDKTVIIEMQVLNVLGFEKRVLYNAAKAFSIQLSAGEDYNLLNPVIALTITDFEMFPSSSKIISRYRLKERDDLTDYSDDIELVFVELPKFHKELEALATLTDKWLYFLKSAGALKSVPPNMATVAEIGKAFTIAEEANLTPKELEELERREIYILDSRNAIRKAVQQGLEQGLEQGMRKQAIAIARNLLDVLDVETISQKTGLSIREIKELANS